MGEERSYFEEFTGSDIEKLISNAGSESKIVKEPDPTKTGFVQPTWQKRFDSWFWETNTCSLR